MSERLSADTVADTKVFVEHHISFHLSDAERFVVPRRYTRGYVSVGYVTVNIHHDQRVWVHAHGSVCKKDGTPSAVTSMNESVDLPDEAVWVERARRALIDGEGVVVSEPRGTNAWSLQCEDCLRFLDWAERLTLQDDQAMHWNHAKRDLCGPVERVELRSETDA